MLAIFELGKAIGPVGVDTVRSRCVDHAGAIICDHRHRFLRRIVGQAKDDEIGIVQCLTPCCGILALVIGQDDLRKFAAA